jgi:hypothetical protein
MNEVLELQALEIEDDEQEANAPQSITITTTGRSTITIATVCR